MNHDLPAIANDASLYLDPQITDRLQTQEDYESYYIHLERVSLLTSWWKADLLLKLRTLFGEESIQELSRRVGAKPGTLGNYVRVARAFTPEKRIPALSFSHHFNASFADEYNDQTNTFNGEQRFDYLEKAADQAWSTRELKTEIDKEKRLKQLDTEVEPCIRCHELTGEIYTYTIYSSEPIKAIQEKFEAHRKCYWKIVEFIHGN